MLSPASLDQLQATFDDHRLVADAGLLLPATLAQHLGLQELADSCVDLGDAPGRANAGDKLLTLVASALAGGDCIDDAAALRAGGTASVLGCTKAPSTLGVFLRSFSWGHVRRSTASAASCSPAAGRPGRDQATRRSRSTSTRRSARPTACQGGCPPARLHGRARLSPAARGGSRDR